MSSGEIAVGARKTAARVITIKNKNLLHKKKEHCELFTTKILLLHIGNLSIQDHLA
jgi:hypothetical protein